MGNNNDAIYEELFTNCKELRLSRGFAERAIEHFDDVSGLNYLLKTERELRRVKTREKAIAVAGFPCRFNEKDFDDSGVIFPDGISYQSLLDLSFCAGSKPRNIVLYGSSGLGKTMLSSILGEKAATSGFMTVYYNTQGLVDDLIDAQEHGVLRHFLKKFDKVKVLILDDFGYIPYSLEGVRLLYRLLATFFGRKSIILNTMMKFSKWNEVIPDFALASCMAGKFMDNAILLRFQGQDRRIEAHRRVSAQSRDMEKADVTTV